MAPHLPLLIERVFIRNIQHIIDVHDIFHQIQHRFNQRVRCPNIFGVLLVPDLRPSELFDLKLNKTSLPSRACKSSSQYSNSGPARTGANSRSAPFPRPSRPAPFARPAPCLKIFCSNFLYSSSNLATRFNPGRPSSAANTAAAAGAASFPRPASSASASK